MLTQIIHNQENCLFSVQIQVQYRKSVKSVSFSRITTFGLFHSNVREREQEKLVKPSRFSCYANTNHTRSGIVFFFCLDSGPVPKKCQKCFFFKNKSWFFPEKRIFFSNKEHFWFQKKNKFSIIMVLDMPLFTFRVFKAYFWKKIALLNALTLSVRRSVRPSVHYFFAIFQHNYLQILDFKRRLYLSTRCTAGFFDPKPRSYGIELKIWTLSN
jgi:hypothetical protein